MTRGRLLEIAAQCMWPHLNWLHMCAACRLRCRVVPRPAAHALLVDKSAQCLKVRFSRCGAVIILVSHATMPRASALAPLHLPAGAFGCARASHGSGWTAAAWLVSCSCGQLGAGCVAAASEEMQRQAE